MDLYSKVDTSKDSSDFRFFSVYLSFFMIFIFVLEQFFGVENFVLYKKVFSEFLFSKFYLLFLSFLSHANFNHLIFNLFSFLLFGLLLEKRIGSKNFVFLFFSSGFIINLLLPFTPYNAVIGVSGVVFFIIGMLSILRPFFIFYFNFIPVPLFLLSFFYFFLEYFNFFYSFDNTAYLIHIFGLILGLIFGFYFRFLGFGDDIFKSKNNNSISKVGYDKNFDFDDNLDSVVDGIVDKIDNEILEENKNNKKSIESKK